MRKPFGWVLAVLTVVILAVAATPAGATSIVFQLTDDHCTGGCGPAGTIFGTVTINDNNGPNLDFLVHLNSPYVFAKTGAADDQAFKFNATGVGLGDITIDPHTPALVASTGAFNGDGTGTFAFGINCPSCGGGLSDAFSTDILFHIANATIADLTAANPTGFTFVADVGNPLTRNTGPVGSHGGCTSCTPLIATPEPASLVLLGSGLVAATRGLRRLKK